MIGVVLDPFLRIIMKIFACYLAFVSLFIVGFCATIYFGFPRSATHDAMIAFSGMIVGALAATLVIIVTKEKQND